MSFPSPGRLSWMIGENVLVHDIGAGPANRPAPYRSPVNASRQPGPPGAADSGQRVPGAGDNGLERLGFANGKIGEYLPVDRDSRL